MSAVISISRRREVLILFSRHRILRKFCVEVDSPTGVKSESQESLVIRFLDQLRKIPQQDWGSSESLDSLLVSSSTCSPLVFSQITRRLDSYSLAVSFFEYLSENSQSLKRREESLSLTFQSVISFAGSEFDSRDKLLKLYETAIEKNIRLTDTAAKLLIRWFGRVGMVSQSVLIYERLDSKMKNPQVRNVVIDVMLRNGLVDDAFKVLDEMLKRESKFPPNKITADIVFHAIWRGKILTEEEIIGLISKFSSHGISPNCVWLTRFITTLCKNGRTNVAWEILSDLMKNKASLEAAPINALLTCLGRKMEIARMNLITEKMDEMEIKPDVVTLGILINTLCKSRRVDEALEVFEQMCVKQTDDGNEIKPDSIHYNTLIDGFCKLGRMKEAEEFLVKMKTEESCKPNTVTYNSLIDGYCRAGQLETAKELVSRMKQDEVKPNVITLNTLIGGICRHHGVNMAVHFFMEMEEEGIKGNVSTYTTLIQAYCNVNNIEKAMHWFDQMVEAKYSPDAKLYYTLISSLCQARLDQDAIKVIKKLKEQGFSLDLLAYNMVIGLFCEKNNVDKINEMVNDMEEANVKPDSNTYNTLVSFFSKNRDFKNVNKLLKNMKQDGLVPNFAIYKAIIEAYCEIGEIEEAFKLFNDMGLDSKVIPNTVIYNLLITAFCKVGDLKQALCLKSEMKEKMVRADVETYNVLFDCLKEKNQLETVFGLMDEMVEDSCEPNQITMEILMKILSDSGKLTKLRSFLQGYSVASTTSKRNIPLSFTDIMTQ